MIDPNSLEDIIGDYENVTDDLFPAVRDALLELRQELLDDVADDNDEMNDEEEAEIDAKLAKYRGADGRISLELVKHHSSPLTGIMRDEFNAVIGNDDENNNG